MPIPSNQEIKKGLEQRLSKSRYLHSLGVAQAAQQLAARYGYDEDKAYLTGLLHDYAKNLPAAELMMIAESKQLIEDEIERRMPEILHAPVGAYLIEQELGIHDPEILQAVRRHTLGALDMSLLDEIIFVADMIEPHRDFPELDSFRKVAFEDLARCVIMTADSSIVYCIEKNKLIHPRSVAMRNLYVKKQSKES